MYFYLFLFLFICFFYWIIYPLIEDKNIKITRKIKIYSLKPSSLFLICFVLFFVIGFLFFPDKESVCERYRSGFYNEKKANDMYIRAGGRGGQFGVNQACYPVNK
tara:strand:- start:62 stop:376 length:315 start_codon:yes stop_codon:yes gene_type:complete